jgi:hypothetical protein
MQRIRTTPRLLRDKEIKKKYLNDVLSAGERSGFEKNLDPKVHLEKLNRRRC